MAQMTRSRKWAKRTKTRGKEWQRQGKASRSTGKDKVRRNWRGKGRGKGKPKPKANVRGQNQGQGQCRSCGKVCCSHQGFALYSIRWATLRSTTVKARPWDGYLDLVSPLRPFFTECIARIIFLKEQMYTKCMQTTHDTYNLQGVYTYKQSIIKYILNVLTKYWLVSP